MLEYSEKEFNAHQSVPAAAVRNPGSERQGGAGRAEEGRPAQPQPPRPAQVRPVHLRPVQVGAQLVHLLARPQPLLARQGPARRDGNTIRNIDGFNFYLVKGRQFWARVLASGSCRGAGMGRQPGCSASHSPHSSAVSLKPRWTGVKVRSWSTNCPHCIIIRLISPSPSPLSSCMAWDTALALGMFFRVLATLSWYLLGSSRASSVWAAPQSGCSRLLHRPLCVRKPRCAWSSCYLLTKNHKSISSLPKDNDCFWLG